MVVVVVTDLSGATYNVSRPCDNMILAIHKGFAKYKLNIIHDLEINWSKTSLSVCATLQIYYRLGEFCNNNIQKNATKEGIKQTAMKTTALTSALSHQSEYQQLHLQSPSGQASESDESS